MRGDQPFVEAFRFGHLHGLVRVDHNYQVEVTVAGMADNQCWQERGCNIFLGRDNTFGQPRNRHTYIGRENLPAWAHRPVCVNDVMSRPPATAFGGPLVSAHSS